MFDTKQSEKLIHWANFAEIIYCTIFKKKVAREILFYTNMIEWTFIKKKCNEKISL